MIEKILIYGAVAGAVYTLLALGFTLIYGVSGVTNLAHGTLFMLGAYIFSTLLSQLEPIPALILAALIVSGIGTIIYRIAIHPIIEDEVAILVVTVCIALIVQQLLLLIYGPSFYPIPPFLEGTSIIWGVVISNARLAAFSASMVLCIGLWIFISKTKIGKAMRAISQDLEVAMLMGINTERLYMLTMGISASFAAIAGIFIASSSVGVAATSMWLEPLAMSFAIVILGGLGSVKGTVIGGFIIGYAQIAVTYLVPKGGMIITAVPFTIMVLVMFIRPKGLFGKRVEMED